MSQYEDTSWENHRFKPMFVYFKKLEGMRSKRLVEIRQVVDNKPQQKYNELWKRRARNRAARKMRRKQRCH